MFSDCLQKWPSQECIYYSSSQSPRSPDIRAAGWISHPSNYFVEIELEYRVSCCWKYRKNTIYSKHEDIAGWGIKRWSWKENIEYRQDTLSVEHYKLEPYVNWLIRSNLKDVLLHLRLDLYYKQTAFGQVRGGRSVESYADFTIIVTESLSICSETVVGTTLNIHKVQPSISPWVRDSPLTYWPQWPVAVWQLLLTNG